jgi:hypothetical protein
MSRFIPLLCVLLAPSLLVQKAVGQGLPEPGTRVRVTVPSGRHAGTLLALGQDTLVMGSERQADTLRIASSGISRIEVSRGQRRRTGRGAIIGLLAGGISVGAGLGVACGTSSGSFLDCSDKVPSAVTFGLLAGGALGAGIGALIGSAISGEKWEAIPFRHAHLRVAPQRDGLWALGASLTRS